MTLWYHNKHYVISRSQDHNKHYVISRLHNVCCGTKVPSILGLLLFNFLCKASFYILASPTSSLYNSLSLPPSLSILLSLSLSLSYFLSLPFPSLFLCSLSPNLPTSVDRPVCVHVCVISTSILLCIDERSLFNNNPSFLKSSFL